MVLERTNRNHSTYWIVNHWDPVKLVNIVSVIMLVNLNWRIYHNYNSFKSGQSSLMEVIHSVSINVPLWIEVLNSIINSKGGSFRWPHSVTAKDVSEYWILIVLRYSKPSKGQVIWVISLCTILINSEYCLLVWFDSIHRCVFHSHYLYPLIQAEVIPALNQHTPFNDHWIFNAYIVCLKSITSFFNHWLGSNHRLTLLHLSPQPRLV